MEESREDRKLAVTETIGKVFGIIMVVLYFILGTTFIFYTPEKIPEQYAKHFGILLYAFGSFRAFKYYRKYFAR
ncbi:MAG: hypothetical protein WD824_09360 [Cyclobacteriaceae bacterium]